MEIAAIRIFGQMIRVGKKFDCRDGGLLAMVLRKSDALIDVNYKSKADHTKNSFVQKAGELLQMKYFHCVDQRQNKRRSALFQK